jgi:predicted DNA-binding transcriptional regulator AlpA
MELQEPTKVEIGGSPEPYLKARDLARMLSIAEDTVKDWYRRYPDFPAIRLPGSIRVRSSEVQAWLEKFTRAQKEIA